MGIGAEVVLVMKVVAQVHVKMLRCDLAKVVAEGSSGSSDKSGNRCSVVVPELIEIIIQVHEQIPP